jgi:EAL domain-containing protein (putative c-di-GMP-specific phosphodiesterase class I)/AmiR/NasT family two-component response regulator
MTQTNILIVEDELLIANNLRRKLIKLGYKITDIVSSGEEALQVAQEKSPNLVLMDIVIEGEMDGIETASKIYNEYRIPVIFLTAYADDDTIAQAEQSQSYGYILKPFQERELHATIKMVLQKHKKETQLLRSLEVAEKTSKKLQDIIKTTVVNLGGYKESTLEKDLHFALEKEQLQIHYQPIVNLQNRQIIGAEALLRWQHPQRAMISPTVFIPLAEQIGLIELMGEWVLREACTQAKSWQTKFSFPFNISVNLSARQFQEKTLWEKIAGIIRETQIEPQLLKLELTESLLVDDTVLVVEIIKKLKALGVQLAIDDFGTGYSGLAYLQQLPFDLIKIDRCFMSNVTRNPDKVALTKAIIDIGNCLNLQIMAEGVENEEEVQFLLENQCYLAQGYLFSPPVPADMFETLL